MYVCMYVCIYGKSPALIVNRNAYTRELGFFRGTRAYIVRHTGIHTEQHRLPQGHTDEFWDCIVLQRVGTHGCVWRETSKVRTQTLCQWKTKGHSLLKEAHGLLLRGHTRLSSKAHDPAWRQCSASVRRAHGDDSEDHKCSTNTKQKNQDITVIPVLLPL